MKLAKNEGKLEAIVRYKNSILELVGALDPLKLEALAIDLLECLKRGNALYICGNGGSASTASTMGNDLLLSINWPCKARICSLVDNTSVLTAIANDFGYDQVFAKQIEKFGRAGDILLTISCSGNSQNLVKAVESCKEQNIRSWGLLGFDGGLLKDLCDECVFVKSDLGLYGPVEDVHVIINHMLVDLLRSHLSCHG